MFKNVEQEAVCKIADNTKFALPGQFVALFGVMYILNDKISTKLLLVGLIVHTVLMLSRLFINRIYKKNKNNFLSLYFTTTALSGIAWGSVLFFIPNLPAEYHLLIFAVFIGLVSGALFTLGEVLHLYFAYILPILTISTIWFITQETTPVYMMGAYFSLFALVYYISAAKKYNVNYNKALSEEKEKILLLEKLKDKSDVFEQLFEHSVIGALIIEDGKFVQCNQKSVDMLGYSTKDELINMSIAQSSPQYQSDGRLSDEKAAEMFQTALDKGSNQFEWLYRKADGKLFLADVHLSSLILSGKKVLYTSWRDVTEEKKLKNSLKYLAHHDTLTSLPNRTLFNDRLEQGIKKAKRGDTSLAIMFIDLDNFKPVNDTFGHDAGDKLLIAVSESLKKSLRSEDTLARIGGDEFTIIIEKVDTVEDIANLANKLMDSLIEPIEIDSNVFSVSLSMGISLYPQDADNAADLLKYSDIAMYKAKENGKNNFKFYKESIVE